MVRGLKIAFTGSGGTGKTSTAAAVSSLLNLPQMKSASRLVYEQQDLNENKVFMMAPAEKWKLQYEIFTTKINNDDCTPSFVADRTLLDHWAYCLLYCSTTIKNDEYMHLEALVRKHMIATYSRIYYFPRGDWTGKDDGIRQTNLAWQEAIDSLIIGNIVKWKLPVVEVPQAQSDDDGVWKNPSDEGPLFRAEFIIEDLKKISAEAQGQDKREEMPVGPKNYEVKEGTQPPYPRVGE